MKIVTAILAALLAAPAWAGDSPAATGEDAAPSEDAIRQAAALNNLPVDSITEVPVDLTP